MSISSPHSLPSPASPADQPSLPHRTPHSLHSGQDLLCREVSQSLESDSDFSMYVQRSNIERFHTENNKDCQIGSECLVCYCSSQADTIDAMLSELCYVGMALQPLVFISALLLDVLYLLVTKSDAQKPTFTTQLVIFKCTGKLDFHVRKL